MSLQRYRIEGELGKGAMGVVHLTWDNTLERRIALKELVFPTGLTSEQHADLLERFHREAKAAARLSHPNVVQVFDVFDEGERHFIAMEVLEGETLASLMDAGRLSAPAAVAITLQILDALDAAHRSGIVHRDVKPDNVFVLSDGRVKVADFGIAKLMEQPGAAATQFGTVLGTPGYMAPEQVLGRDVDARSDIFAVGAIAYELLSGRNPFLVDTPTATLYRIVNEEPAPLAGFGVPTQLADVVLTALAKRPEQRYPSAAVMAHELRLAVGQAPGPDGDPAGETRGFPAALIIGLSAAAALALGGMLLFSGGSDASPPVVTVPTAIVTTMTAIPADPQPGMVPPAVEESEQSPGAGLPPAFWAAFCGGVSDEKDVSQKQANRVQAKTGLPTLVLNLGDYGSIGAAGDTRWVTCAGPFDSQAEAEQAMGTIKAAGIDAYVKRVE